MKYCINCLSENPDDAKRCQNCKFEFGQALDILAQNKKHGKKEVQTNKSKTNG